MTRMYKESRKTWNPFWGCRFDCKYCYPSFRRQARRQLKRCRKCADYIPHFHPERLAKPLPRTGEGEFIFTCDMGDIAFAEEEWIYAILKRIRELPDRTFLIQSKDPRTFHAFIFPSNVILGTTIETNRSHLIQEISKAPMPWYRQLEMKRLNHPRKMVTIEPILEFDLDELVRMVVDINPWRVYIGYDSHPKENRLPEPPLRKFDKLEEELKKRGIDVRVKYRRKAWWE